MTEAGTGRHALGVLEYPAALSVVAGHASSSLGAAAIRARTPRPDPSWVEAELQRVQEGMRLMDAEEGWSMPVIPEADEAIDRLRIEGSALLPEQLRDLYTLLQSASSLRRFLTARGDAVERLAAEAENLIDEPSLASAIDRVVGEDGEVRDNASPELSRLRREAQGARGRIVQKLTEYTASLPSQYQVPDASVSVREGRYVVAVRREGRNEVGGIVHGESQTGSTLFVEPPVAIELMNRLRELEAAEAREVHRILRELSATLRPAAPALHASLETLVDLDTVYGRARYADGIDASMPEVVAGGAAGLRIQQGRHPLLLAREGEVVPFDLEMEDEECTLVISGPNTGGKTVFLKTIGLVTLLVETGIIPPLGPRSRIPLYRNVFADIGDEQSIEASLSTFSAHLRNLGETLDAADGESLVLIDEIGSGTDPVEGAALAQAILLELTDRRAFTVATTHLGSLKLLAADDDRIVNASLQFDAERLEPTYRLLKGVPGRSYGLAIARRLGLPADLLGRAEAVLPQGERDVGKLLLDLEAKEQRASELEADLERRSAETERLSAELEERERDLGRREKDAERRARQQARDLLMQSRSEVEAAIREVRSVASEEEMEETARAARRRVEEAARKQREKTPTAPRAKSAGRSAPSDLEVGGRVRIESIGRTGTLKEIRDEKGIVDIDGLKMNLPLSDLTMLPPGDQKPGTKPRKRPAGGRIEAAMEARPEVDLRGLRVDELDLSLGRALDNAIVAGLPSFRIIHGKGTGALRSEVHDLLTQDPRIATFRPGERFEGGTGVTVVEFA